MLYMHACNEIGPLPVESNPQVTIIIRPLPYHGVPPVGVVLHGSHSTDDGEGPYTLCSKGTQEQGKMDDQRLILRTVVYNYVKNADSPSNRQLLVHVPLAHDDAVVDLHIAVNVCTIIILLRHAHFQLRKIAARSDVPVRPVVCEQCESHY